MENDQADVAVFRSSDPDTLAKAVTLLKACGITCRVVDRNEGSGWIPYRVYWVYVSPEDSEKAMQSIGLLPNEMSPPNDALSLSNENRSIARFYLMALAVGLIVAAIISFLARSAK